MGLYLGNWVLILGKGLYLGVLGNTKSHEAWSMCLISI